MGFFRVNSPFFLRGSTLQVNHKSLSTRWIARVMGGTVPAWAKGAVAMGAAVRRLFIIIKHSGSQEKKDDNITLTVNVS